MGKQVRSERNFWGGYDHYDENGFKVGESKPSFWGGYDTYDSDGIKTGESRPNFWGGLDHYDLDGIQTGSICQMVLTDSTTMIEKVTALA